MRPGRIERGLFDRINKIYRIEHGEPDIAGFKVSKFGNSEIDSHLLTGDLKHFGFLMGKKFNGIEVLSTTMMAHQL